MPLGELVDEVHVAVFGRDVDGSVADLREKGNLNLETLHDHVLPSKGGLGG